MLGPSCQHLEDEITAGGRGCQTGAARSTCWLLVVTGQLCCLGGNLLKDVIDEAVQDGHGLGGDASVGVDLLEYLIDIYLEGLCLRSKTGLFTAAPSL